MRICILGGIFGKPASYREAVRATPETTLAEGLRRRGHAVVTYAQDRAPGRLDAFDVVHAHHLARGTMYAAARRRRGPLVFTSHWFGEETSVVRRAAQRYVLARADASIALSEIEAVWQAQRLPRRAGPPHVIANGIEDSLFPYSPPPSPPPPGNPWRILFVGQLASFKGVHFLLDALSRLSRRLTVELQLAFHVDDERTALEAQVERLGLERVRFLGPRTPEGLAPLYAASHVLVLPSTAEALPQVISEALLVGRPVVGTDVGAVREQVAGYGAVVAPRDSQALADALEHVCANYAGLTRQAAAVSAAARRRYSVAAMVDAHEALYEELLRRGRLRTRREDFVDAVVRALLWTADRRSFRGGSPETPDAWYGDEQHAAEQECERERDPRVEDR